MQDAANDQVPVNPTTITDGWVREALLQMAEAITTLAQAITTQTNREDVPCENKHVITLTSRLRDFTRMNPHMYF